MGLKQEIVVTGLGVFSPIGIGPEPFAAALLAGRSGVRKLSVYSHPGLPLPVGADIAEFDAKQCVRPRKSLKVMSRDIQLGVAAADMACEAAGLHAQPVDPERFGVVFGADLMPCDLDEMVAAYRGCVIDGRFHYDLWWKTVSADLYPLWMLKYLPNMPACHIAIGQDARGPNNSLTLGDVSSLAAMTEAMRVIERGQADVIIAGGASSRVHPVVLLRRTVGDTGRNGEDPATICRPFDAHRRGAIHGEGSVAMVIETRQHAAARGAKPLARLLGYGTAFEPIRRGRPRSDEAIRRALRGALCEAGITPADVGHVNAHGMSTIEDDRLEAAAIRDVLGDVPVTAAKSYFGNAGAASGAMELAVSLVALERGLTPPTLNYEFPDPQCPVNVVHGRPAPLAKPLVVKLSHVYTGQAVAVVLAAP